MSADKLSKEQRSQLIELVKERPVLYNKQHRLWRSVKEKEYRWKEIASLCNATDAACKKAWKTMRDQYNRYLKAPKNKRKKFRFIPELIFLGGIEDNDLSENVSDFSDYSEPKPRKRKIRSKTIKRAEREVENSSDDEDNVTMSSHPEIDHEEYIYVKDMVEANKSTGNITSELFSTFNRLLCNGFELNEDDNDIFLRMLAKKMKCLPSTVKNRLQEGFLEQVNFETLQCTQK